MVSLLLLALQSIALIWWIYLQTQLTHTSLANYAFNVVYGSVFAVGGFAGIRSGIHLGGLRATVGRALILIAAGLVCYSIGQVIWAYYNVVLHQDAPYPSGADVFFASSLLLFAVGFLQILRMYQTFITKKTAIESIVVCACVVSIVFLLVGMPEIDSENAIATLLNWYYPIFDAVLASLAFMTLRMRGGSVDKGLFAYIAGMLFLALGDNLFTIRSNNDQYWNGDVSDLMFALAGFFLSLGIVFTARSFATTTSPTTSPTV